MIQPFNIIKSNNSTNKNNLNFIINNLPIDIVKIIYIDYIKPDLICIELNFILNSIQSQQLNCYPLYKFLKNNNILQNKIIVKYLLKNDYIFQQVYKDHIINKIKVFIRFPDMLGSFAKSWLMYLYH
jgi:hypothetical protein